MFGDIPNEDLALYFHYFMNGLISLLVAGWGVSLYGEAAKIYMLKRLREKGISAKAHVTEILTPKKNSQQLFITRTVGYTFTPKGHATPIKCCSFLTQPVDVEDAFIEATDIGQEVTVLYMANDANRNVLEAAIDNQISAAKRMIFTLLLIPAVLLCLEYGFD